MAKSSKLINVQDGINVQGGKFFKINKRAGWNNRAGRKVPGNLIKVQEGIKVQGRPILGDFQYKIKS